MPSTDVLHIDQTIASLDPWKDVPAADGKYIMPNILQNNIKDYHKQ